MKNIVIIAILAIGLAGCNKSDETVSAGSKENLDKSMAVIAKRQQELRDSNKHLRDDGAPR